MSKELENIFKNKFEQFEENPSSDLFDRIQAKRKKKSRAVWYWAAASLLILGGLGIWFSQSNEPGDISIESTTDTEIVLNEKDQSVDNAELTIESTNSTTDSDPEMIENEAIKKIVTNSQPKNAKVDGLNKVRVENSPLIIENEIRNQTNRSNKQIINKDLADLYQKIIKNKATKENKTQNQLEKETPNNDNSFNSSNNENESVEMVSIDESEKDDIVSEETTEIEPRVQGDGDEKEQDGLPIHRLVAKSKWSIELTGGLGYSGRLLAGNTDYVQLRNSSETPQISNVVDLRAIYELGTRWNVQFGLNLIQRQEEFSYTSPNRMIITYREETVKETVIHPVLGEQEVERTVIVEEKQEIKGEETTAQNEFTYVSIPITFERDLWSRNNFTLVGRGGFMAGVRSSSEGKFLGSDGEVYELNASPFRSAGIHTANLGLGILVKSSDRLTLVAHPNLNIGLNSSFSNDYILSQRTISGFGSVGVRVRL